jgi:peptidoglycan/xylan/chitin deacetylase (PgdA/CDA1 family)
MREADDGDIVLMHDIHEPTMKAAVKLIPKLKAAGFELVTVSELAKFKGKKLKNGTVYYSF